MVEKTENTKKPKPFHGVTPAQDALLRGSPDMPVGLYHLHLATAKQLCRLHYSEGSFKHVRSLLCLLSEHKYTQFSEMPTTRGRPFYYYTLGSRGVRYLRAAGLEVGPSFRTRKEIDKAHLFVEHTLELNDIIISAALLKDSNPTYWLEGFIHERELKRRPYKATWTRGEFSLIPDASLVFQKLTAEGKRPRLPVSLEHDRGSEQESYFRRRIHAYALMLRNEGYKTIAFTTSAGKQRVNKMREWTTKELETVGGLKAFGSAFYFTHLKFDDNNPIDPSALWLKPCWLGLQSYQPTSLLEV